MKRLFLLSLFLSCSLFSDNQTSTLSPILSDESLPFRLKVQQSSLSLPTGLHSFASAIYKDKWVIIGGRTNGLHGFDPVNNFPPERQNTSVYVVDIENNKVYSRSLFSSMAGLSQQQIDLLSVTSPQSYQTSKTLYITGGYGIDTALGQFNTKSFLTAIDIPELIQWVVNPQKGQLASKSIRHLSHPIFQVTGGFMDRNYKDDVLLIFGQNFIGQYQDSSNGIYTQQVRRFKILDDGKSLSVKVKSSNPEVPNPNFRRRDLNVVPVMQDTFGLPLPAFIAFSGVFTETDGAWTVPVEISSKGVPFMPNPNSSSTFKQGMNNYVSATVGMYSEDEHAMYVVLLGGITFGYFENGVFVTDSELPFTNQITTVKRDRNGVYTQYLNSAQYPTLISTGPNPGNPLLFGAGAVFMPLSHTPNYRNGVIKFDKLNGSQLIGYIVGGIESTLPNTNTQADSTASPYIFEVYVEPI